MPDRSFNLADLFELVAAAIPDREAVVAGDRRMTYGELDRRTNQLARHYLATGVEPGGKVAIYSWNRVEWLEAFIAAFKARLIPINVNYRYVPAELSYLLENADAEIVVHEADFGETVGQVEGDLPRLKHRLVIDGDYEDALAAQSDGPLDMQRSPDDLYFLYTGGTTGMPKGVMWRQEDIYFAALTGSFTGGPPITTPEEIVERIVPEPNKSLVMAPLMHGAAQWGTMIMLFGGNTPVLYTGRGLDAHEVCRIAERERCTGITLVGDAMGRPLADAIAEGSYDLSSVVSVSSGGGVFSPAVQDELRKLLPGVFVLDTYGASETGASGTNLTAEARRFAVSPEMTVLGDDLRPVAVGEVGRMARGGHIPLGYYKDDAKTAATFPVDADGKRWVVPGDFAVIQDDGTILLLGRGSQCINTGGEKVYPEEVEAALKSHPDVFDALVVGVPDDRFGERVAAVVAPRAGRAPTVDDLSTHCRDLLARYKLPRQVTLVDAIKRTPAGKADYRWAKDVASA